MPIYVDDKKFERFSQAVAYVKQTKGYSDERARAYVGGIEKKQRARPRRRVRYKGK